MKCCRRRVPPNSSCSVITCHGGKCNCRTGRSVQVCLFFKWWKLFFFFLFPPFPPSGFSHHHRIHICLLFWARPSVRIRITSVCVRVPSLAVSFVWGGALRRRLWSGGGRQEGVHARRQRPRTTRVEETLKVPWCGTHGRRGDACTSFRASVHCVVWVVPVGICGGAAGGGRTQTRPYMVRSSSVISSTESV